MDFFRNNREEFEAWFQDENDIDMLFSAIEYFFIISVEQIKSINYVRDGQQSTNSLNLSIKVINARFKEAGFGYEIVGGQIVKIANEVIHAEAVLPALAILRDPAYKNANDEFRAAFDAFKAGDNEQCLVECCKALESVLKVIGSKKGWELTGKETLGALIGAANTNGLIPDYMLNQFNGLRNCLIAVGTIRNKEGGHGAGEQERNVPDHLAAYQLHLTASAIVFLEACGRS